jgi:hypothetical protein
VNALRVDITKLMYQTFQSCRSAQPDAGDCLHVLAAALAAMEQQATFIVPIPRSIGKRLPGYISARVRVLWFAPIRKRDIIPAAAQPFLALATIATADLQRLWVARHVRAVRSLGYALHNLPQFLHIPASFDREAYLHSFRIASAHWPDLSPALQHQFCSIIDLPLEEAQQMLAVWNT